MKCNIDATGRRMRAVSGALCTVVGIGLLAAIAVEPAAALPLAISGSVIAACGLFQIFESWAGWCAVRAMGLKTKW
jgi:hypothetical protein